MDASLTFILCGTSLEFRYIRPLLNFDPPLVCRPFNDGDLLPSKMTYATFFADKIGGQKRLRDFFAVPVCNKNKNLLTAVLSIWTFEIVLNSSYYPSVSEEFIILSIKIVGR